MDSPEKAVGKILFENLDVFIGPFKIQKIIITITLLSFGNKTNKN